MLPFLQNAPTVPRLLKDASYRSLQTGKFWEGHYANGGFTNGMTTKGRHGDAGLVIGRQTMKPIYEFIDANVGQPFFIWYAPMMPHEPHNPPERILRKYTAPDRNPRMARYWAMCEWLDETCGDLLSYIDKKGLRDNTLVVFVVDNGWIQETGPARRIGGSYAAKSKLSPYDGGVRTPVILRWPGHTKSGLHDDLVSTIDLAPTILAACNVKPTKQMRGLNLLDTAAGKGRLRRDAVFGEIYLHTAVNIDKPALNLTHRWVRQGDWKLILFQEEQGHKELYNLRRDPFEKDNLAEQHPEEIQALGKVLEKWWDGRR
jgi:arylsulfatase A-like enzyme